MLPQLPRFRGPDLPVGQGPRPRRAVRACLQRLDGRGSAAPAAGACCRCASCRSGTPSASPPPRCGATPRAVCTPSHSPRSPPTSVYRHPYWLLGSVLPGLHEPAPSSACTSLEQDAAGIPDATCSAGVADLRQQRGEPRRLPLLGRARPVPEDLRLLYAEAQLELDPVRAGAGRRRVDHPPVERRSGRLRRPTTTGRCTAASSRTRSA